MISDKMKQVLESYNKGLESYKTRAFEEAKKAVQDMKSIADRFGGEAKSSILKDPERS